MTDRRGVAEIAAGRRPSARGLSSLTGKPALHVEIAEPGAKVMLLPGKFRGAGYIRTHVAGVVEMGAEKGERHIVRNLAIIRDRLEELGIDEPAIAAELRRIEGAVRAELWRQILLPEEAGGTCP